MTVKAFWMDAYVTTTHATYWIVTDRDREFRISQKHAATVRTDPEFPHGWRVERRLVTQSVPACPWCGARPLVFEMDCDGWASTGTCGSPQCNGLSRCEGCGEDGTQRWGSWRGQLCDRCHTVADARGLVVIPGEYGLFPYEEYSKYYA